MKPKKVINVEIENERFLSYYQKRWNLMKAARNPYDIKWNAIDATMLKKPQYDSYGNYLVALKEEHNVMEMSAGREWTNLNYTLRPTWEPDQNEILVAKMMLDYQIYAGGFHDEWKRGLGERRRYWTCCFFTGIWEKTARSYKPSDESDWLYDVKYDEVVEIQNIFTPQWIPIRNVWVDDKAIHARMSDATDCIIQETLTYEEVMKRWGNNPNFKHLNLLKKQRTDNFNQPYPLESIENGTNDENKPIIIHRYYNRDTGDMAIIANYNTVIYRGKMISISWQLPIAMAQYFPDETCLYGIWIPEKIQPMVVYKEEIVQNLLDNSRMSGSPLLLIWNRSDVDGTQNIRTNRINKISMTGGVNDMQLTQVASNVGNYQAVLQFIDNQITMDTGENLRSTYEPSAAQLGTVEIIENNRNTRLGSLEDGKNNLLAACLNAAMDNIVQFWYKLINITKKTYSDGKLVETKVETPKIVVPDRKIKQKGVKIEIEEEDMGDYGYFEFKKDMIKQRFRVIVQTVSNNGVWKMVDKNNLTQYVQNKVALWQLNPQLATPEEIKNIGKLMDLYWDYNFNTFPESKKDKKRQQIAEMKESIMQLAGMNEWGDAVSQMMGWQSAMQQAGMQQLTPASPIEWVPQV